MKKIIIAIFFVSLCLTISNVSAMTRDEYDRYTEGVSKISMPLIVRDTGTEVTAKEGITNYELYHQWIAISDTEKALIDEKKQELKDVQTEMNEYVASATDKTSDEYKTTVETYQGEANAILDEFASLLPTYSENNWVKLGSDNKVKFNSTGTEMLWVKLVESDGTTSYAFDVYTNSKKEDTATKIETNKTSSSDSNIETTDDDDDEYQTDMNPNTGLIDNPYLITGALLISGIIIVLRRRMA